MSCPLAPSFGIMKRLEKNPFNVKTVTEFCEGGYTYTSGSSVSNVFTVDRVMPLIPLDVLMEMQRWRHS